ncbi:Superkiller protein 3 [Tieghemiomyces parasiticus]|uniref:Superkiller protein 3 n=1 Tax=Tieghemiomyces parasiticus TaxID=78921 RepID=A0A9W8AHV8_9FUNG|nr:Superkiller protein 3 [Tieghemiomyces parasiticus]
MSSKAKLKQAKEAIGQGQYEISYKLTKSIVEFESQNYTAWVFLGVSCQNLDRWGECEKAYRRALDIDDTQVLAWQGLASLYEKQENYEELPAVLARLCDHFVKANAGAKLLGTLQKRLTLAEATKDTSQIIKAWCDMASDGPYGAVLDGVASRPTDLSIWQTVVDLQLTFDQRTVRREVDSRRSRIGADPLRILRPKVEKEILGRSHLLEYLTKWFAAAPDSDEDTPENRRMHERYFDRLYLTLKYFDTSETMAARVTAEARWLCERQVSAAPFEYLIETTDAASPAELPKSTLQNYVAVFPDATLVPATRALLFLQEPQSNSDSEAALGRLQEATKGKDVLHHLTLLARATLYAQVGDDAAAADDARRAVAAVAEFAKLTGRSWPRLTVWAQFLLGSARRRLGPRYYPEARLAYEAVLHEDPEHLPAKVGLSVILIAAGEFDRSTDILAEAVAQDPRNDVALAELGWVNYQRQNYQGALDHIRRALELQPDEPRYHYRLGQVYWDLGGAYRTDKAYAFTSWLRAAKLNPQDSPTFVGLGEYYATVAHDPTRALKCYQKAFELDPRDDRAGRALVGAYQGAGRLDLVGEVAAAVVRELPRAGWAWRVLAFERLRRSEYRDAILAFQQVLKTGAADPVSWEGLGEAYHRDGRFQAALRALQRAAELDPQSPGPAYRLGLVYHALGEFGAALERYSAAREHIEGRLPAEAGAYDRALLAATLRSHLALARVHMEGGYYGRAAAGARTILGLARRALADKVTPALLSMLLDHVRGATEIGLAIPTGDDRVGLPPALLRAVAAALADLMPDLVATMPERTTVTAALLEPAGTDTDESGLDTATLTAALALLILRAQLTRVSPHEHPAKAANLHFHLARLSYRWHTAPVPFGHRPLVSAENDADWRRPAVIAAKAALQLQPRRPEYWNLLGVLALDTDLALAQHALIQAVTYQPKHAAAWTNLGYLYLRYGDLELANRAFAKVQSLSPDFAPAWAGQGLLALRFTGEASGNEAEGEALSLLHHAFSLGGSGYGTAAPEVAYLFAHTYARHLSSGTGNPAEINPVTTTVAAFAARKVVERWPSDTGARNLLAVLLESAGKHREAAETLAPAYGADRMKPDPRYPEPWPVRWAALTANYARVTCAAGDYDFAVSLYSELLASLVDPAAAALVTPAYTLCALLGQGLAQYLAADLGASLGTFEQALAYAESDPDLLRDASILLAKVLWALGTPDHRAMAKQQLLASVSAAVDGSQDANRQPPAALDLLATLFALGLVDADVDLVGAVLPELLRVSPDADRGQCVLYLRTHLALLQGDVVSAQRMVSRAVHVYPDNRAHWTALSQLLRYGAVADAVGGAAMPPAQTLSTAVTVASAAVSVVTSVVTPGASESTDVDETLHTYLTLALAYQTCLPNLGGYGALRRPLVQAKKAAQRAVHLAPWQPYGHLVLAQTLIAEVLVSPTTDADAVSKTLATLRRTLAWLGENAGAEITMAQTPAVPVWAAPLRGVSSTSIESLDALVAAVTVG